MAITLDGSNGITTDIASNESATFNRDTTNGDLIILQKDNATVGSIGTYDTDIHIGSGDVGLSFYDVGDTVLPFNPSTPVYRDNAIDLGNSSNRFKNLYLSGGVYLGGASAANYLDDYEIGTWTPVVNSGTYVSTSGYYEKIGNLVHVTVYIDNGSRGSGGIVISGLPFACSNPASNGIEGTGTFITRFYSAGFSAFYVSRNSTSIEIYKNTTSNWSDVQHTDWTQNGWTLHGSITYRTDA